jgi:hypothetical protein
MMEMLEKEIWIKFLNKEISVTKCSPEKERFYKGILIDVLDDKIVLKDRKIGTILLYFDGLSIVEVEESK